MGVPLVVFIIVGVVAMYCICSHYQNRKMRRATLAYANRRERERRADDSAFLAPPPYTPTETTNKTTESDLPSYTMTDPYKNTAQSPTQQELAVPEQEPETEVSAAPGSVIELEDVPLLSDGEQNS